MQLNIPKIHIKAFETQLKATERQLTSMGFQLKAFELQLRMHGFQQNTAESQLKPCKCKLAKIIATKKR